MTALRTKPPFRWKVPMTELRTKLPRGKKVPNSWCKEAWAATIAQITINRPEPERVEVARINGLGSLVEQNELKGDSS